MSTSYRLSRSNRENSNGKKAPSESNRIVFVGFVGFAVYGCFSSALVMTAIKTQIVIFHCVFCVSFVKYTIAASTESGILSLLLKHQKRSLSFESRKCMETKAECDSVASVFLAHMYTQTHTKSSNHIHIKSIPMINYNRLSFVWGYQNALNMPQ